MSRLAALIERLAGIRPGARAHGGAAAGQGRAYAGGSRALPELFVAADLRFDFGEETIARVVDAVEGELGRMGE